ncbi:MULTISPECIES: hypothetical protein [Prochlorococcus]|uniref:hypothetical protein n=1 Tax=Prochlorococcus TaxID=1218 RepID=UPI000533726C|nr:MULTISPECIES: hypothetical protein [Prochlorococcus]KGG12453.1 hypothetical protein EV05_1665 [Prochlorococcus sp. MIT 0601]
MITEFCSANDTKQKRRLFLHERKLEILIYYRDSLERRIAALNASIETLQMQISRDKEVQ